MGGNEKSATIEPTLSATARYVKFEYTTKGASTNYGLGSISIAKPDLRQEASLAWNPSAVTLTQGDEFTAPTLQYPNNITGTITYKSNNDEVATVTAGGEIALASAIEEGETATITATFAGDLTYKPATATCTITVNEYIETIDGEWELVTDASKLQAGMEIIIASVEVDGKYYTMSKASNNRNNRTAVESTISGDKLNPAVGTSVLTLVDAGNGTFALQAGNNYLYAASSTSNHLKETATIKDDAKWSVSVTEGKASVVAQGSNTRNTIRYNSNDTLFSCYASGQKDIAIYARVPDHSRTTSAGRYGTICLPDNIVKCLGATLYEVAGKDYMIPFSARVSRKVVLTETESMTASTAMLPASAARSSRGIPSLSKVFNNSGSTSSKLFGASFFLAVFEEALLLRVLPPEFLLVERLVELVLLVDLFDEEAILLQTSNTSFPKA